MSVTSTIEVKRTKRGYRYYKLRKAFSKFYRKHSAFIDKYEGCSNMNASSFITFFTYMLRQNGKRFYKGLYVTFQLAPDLKKNTVYLSSYNPSNEGHVSTLLNSMI